MKQVNFTQKLKSIPVPKTQDVVTLFVKKKLLVAWFLVVTTLSCLSIYNAYWVLYSYCTDNTVTEVNVKTLENIYPFVRSISLYYKFYDKGVFPQTWEKNETELDLLLPWRPEERTIPDGGWPAVHRLAGRIGKKSFYPHSSNGSLPLESLIDAAAITDMAFQMDNQFFQCGDDVDVTTTKGRANAAICEVKAYNGEMNFSMYSLGRGNESITRKLTSVIDAYMKPDYGEYLTDTAVADIVQSDYWNTGRLSSVPVHIVVDGLGLYGMELTIPLDFVDNFTTADNDPFVEILPFGMNDTIFPEFGAIRVWLDEFSVRGDTEPHQPVVRWNREAFTEIPAATPIEWLVKFQNAGVFDSKEVRDEDECKVCGDLRTVHECLFKCKLDAVVDECGCIPFTYRRIYRDDQKRNWKPYCNSTLYKACYHSSGYTEAYRKCNGEAYVPCVMTQNSFDIFPETRERDKVEVLKHKLNFRLYSDKSSYILFHSKEKNSWMEMLGQLGGNLGVFLSFSLLGLWKFLVFLLLYLQRWHEKRFGSTSDTFVSSWLRFAQLNAEVNATKMLVEEDAERRHSALQSGIEKMNENYENVKDENEKLKMKLIVQEKLGAEFEAMRKHMQMLDRKFEQMTIVNQKALTDAPESPRTEKDQKRLIVGGAEEEEEGVSSRL